MRRFFNKKADTAFCRCSAYVPGNITFCCCEESECSCTAAFSGSYASFRCRRQMPGDIKSVPDPLFLCLQKCRGRRKVPVMQKAAQLLAYCRKYFPHLYCPAGLSSLFSRFKYSASGAKRILIGTVLSGILSSAAASVRHTFSQFAFPFPCGTAAAALLFMGRSFVVSSFAAVFYYSRQGFCLYIQIQRIKTELLKLIIFTLLDIILYILIIYNNIFRIYCCKCMEMKKG